MIKASHTPVSTHPKHVSMHAELYRPIHATTEIPTPVSVQAVLIPLIMITPRYLRYRIGTYASANALMELIKTTFMPPITPHKHVSMHAQQCYPTIARCRTRMPASARAVCILLGM